MMSRNDVTERLALTLTVGAVALVALTAMVLATPTLRLRLSPGRDPVAYRVGDRIDVPQTLFETAPKTVVLFARASCEVCQKHRKIYADLVLDLRAIPAVRIVMVSGVPDQPDDFVYAHAIGLLEQDRFVLSSRDLRLRRVPSLVVVDRSGTILGSWEGVPGQTSTEQFVAEVRAVLQR